MDETSGFVTANVMPGKTNAMVKNIMSQMNIADPNEAVRRINSGEWIVVERVRRWREQDGIIYFTLPPTDGTTGRQWIERLAGKKIQIGEYSKYIFLSNDFKPTIGIITEIAVIKGMLFEDSERVTKNIRAMAESLKFTKPNPEVACLIREMFTDAEIEEMGLRWIVAMHEPIKDSDGVPFLLGTYRDAGGPWLVARCGRPDDRWFRDSGFAFAVTQA